MRKRDELQREDSCINRAGDDEPVFVLRAKDVLASALVRTWAEFADATGAHEPERAAEARELADLMDEWAEAQALSDIDAAITRAEEIESEYVNPLRKGQQ